MMGQYGKNAASHTREKKIISNANRIISNNFKFEIQKNNYSEIKFIFRNGEFYCRFLRIITILCDLI
jgi:hypothetical protein